MKILINGKLAALKENTSFEYIADNRLFSGSDGYSLTITFPLRGCSQNLAIFGNINRADVAANKVIFDCQIIDRALVLRGSIVVTEISQAEVKTQFLEGRSEVNLTLPSMTSTSTNLTSVRRLRFTLRQSLRCEPGMMASTISLLSPCRG